MHASKVNQANKIVSNKDVGPIKTENAVPQLDGKK